jgi:transcriptional regulator with XRE-family HTH domain
MHALGCMGVGAQLRRARESRGLTVRDVADRTKISSRQIDAIESEHYEKLPGGIFGRGYVRAVADALKLDADAIVEAYRDETEPERSAMRLEMSAEPGDGSAPVPTGRKIPMAWRAERPEPRMRMAPVDVVPSRGSSRWVAVVLIGLGVMLLMLWLGRDRGVTPTTQAPSAPARDVRAAAQPPAPEPTQARDRPVGTIGEAPRGKGAEVTDLLIVADRASWLALTVDGRRVASRTLRPREAVHARMRARATLRTRDAGALRLSIDGGPAQPLGPSGTAKILEITPPAR